MSTDTATTGEAYAIALAYELGFRAGQHALATRCEALEGAWKPLRPRTWDEQVADRITQFEACAARSGRPEHHGGPVAWDYDEDALGVAA